MSKIKILFTTNDRAGVCFYRITEPALDLQRRYSDKFDIEINQQDNFTKYDIQTKYSSIFSGNNGYINTKSKI